MMSETAFDIYYWGVYVWFAIGACLIGIPAIIQVVKMLTKKDDAK